MEADKAKEEAKLESQSTTIITQEDIAQKQAKSVEDIIFNETGVTRTVDAMGRVGVSIRGAEPRHTLILIDGQPVMGDFAKYSGQGDELQRIGTENVDHIEIIRGAASAKYGADAIGGVVNVVTRKAAKMPGLQVNVEGRRAKQDSDIFPYQNVFFRADSGKIGKFRAALYGGKRDIMPIYGHETFGGILQAGSGGTADGTRVRNSLRYYGDIKNIGMSMSYDINERHTIDMNIDKVTENMNRYIKHSDSAMEPQQHFKRDLDRNTYRLSYKGNNGGSTDWKVDVDYSKMTEDDIALTSQYGSSKYEGKNTLHSLDDIDHKQWNVKASANTQVHDAHLLTYGFGYTKETGEGSRLKNAPDTYSRAIDPWDYDKNLHTEGGVGAPDSNIHEYLFLKNKDGVPYYDHNYEYYGTKDENGKVLVPPVTYGEYMDSERLGPIVADWPPELLARANAFRDELNAENGTSFATGAFAMKQYFENRTLTYHGKKFKEEYDRRQNHLLVGKAELRKQYAFVQDTWQLNDRTVVAPIFRMDHSNLFGTNATFNLGLTHNLGGRANRRFKANIGTGYTEPGMGELYYNWEMYAGSPESMGIARLGYYWIGNPDLMPEKSLNFDIGLEGESGKATARMSLFHNEIDDYMTTYFTGYLMDLVPANSTAEKMAKYVAPPDMIYSFKNIGKAEITGVETEMNYQFDDHWSGRLGYTYLHAINKSDPDMPRQLLDKPQHKVDIGVTYENKKGGWRASLWGNYYINMLDSNSIANNGNYMEWNGTDYDYHFAEGGKQYYEKKTFGLWNFLVQKDIAKDSRMYFGIDNLFNHHDDDRALQERIYKFGVNLKFGADGHADGIAAKTVARAKDAVRDKLRDPDWFIQSPFDTEKKEGVAFIGDYRAQWNSFTGKNKPEARVTTTTDVGTAAKNMFEKAEHGFTQRLRAGIDARIGENTNVTLLGSASGMTGIDTMHDVSDSKGLNHQRMDTVDVTQHTKKWDFSIGRLTEPMGITGYWFGKEYDGGRAVWTSGTNQVRIGYGDFSQSTGVADSAYTHATRQWSLRSPTKEEWLGYDSDPNDGDGDGPVVVPGYESFRAKIAKAQTEEEQRKIIQEYLDVVKAHDPEAWEKLINPSSAGDFNGTPNVCFFVWRKVTITDRETGAVLGTYLSMQKPYNIVGGSLGNYNPIKSFFDPAERKAVVERLWKSFETELEKPVITNTGLWRPNPDSPYIRYTFTEEFMGYGKYTGNTVFEEVPYYYDHGTPLIPINQVKPGDIQLGLTKEQAKELSYQSLTDPALNWWGSGDGKVRYGAGGLGGLAYSIWNELDKKWTPENDSSLPLTFLPALVPSLSTVLVQDQIPPLDKAAFAQFKHQFGDDFGVQAWYLRSVSDDTHSISYANQDHNDVASFDQLANVIGLGATWRIGDTIRFSYEWGQNRTAFGRFMNGGTNFKHVPSSTIIDPTKPYVPPTVTNDSFEFKGRNNGGTPHFWVARVDIGKSDTDRPGSWNAFADYKYFQHGSFFGGNGTEGVPDRYLDGIKSFTVGGGYVPAKDFLLEAFYTFGAKGIGKRDTLYGPENFTLGDYTRVQVSYKF